MENAQPRFFQISLRTLMEIVAIVAFVLALAYQRIGTSGRYQITSAAEFNGKPDVFMYDSATGRVWKWDGVNDSWIPQTPPGLGK